MHARLQSADLPFFASSCVSSQPQAAPTVPSPTIYPAVPSPRVATRFGPLVDVRNRGVLKAPRRVFQTTNSPHCAVVRVWQGDCCREMTAAEARSFAGQLMAAASHAENQNGLYVP